MVDELVVSGAEQRVAGVRPDLRRMFVFWIRATLMRKAEYRLVSPQMDDLQELNDMLAERLEAQTRICTALAADHFQQRGTRPLLAAEAPDLRQFLAAAMPPRWRPPPLSRGHPPPVPGIP
ncbi:MAG: hypothetical protein AW07_02472 [Candidatus Accumulibacter sp. SK-11]|nr:MAG: hypothetical protein AW07_02472 [Candidatus Accumulibacter sp. SK-11]